MNGGSDPYKLYLFLKEYNEKLQMHICKVLWQTLVSCRGQHKIAKITIFLDNLRGISQEGSMETRQITSFFSSTYSPLTVCNIHFLFENSQNSFSCGNPLRVIPICNVEKRWINVVYFNVDINNVRQRRNNIVIFNVDMNNVGKRRNNVVKMTVSKKSKTNHFK